MLEKTSGALLLALVAFLPFEPLGNVFGLSVLQWLFAFLAATSAPRLWRQRRELLQHRVVFAGCIFLLVCSLSALASDYPDNAAKGVVRIAAGLVLFAIALTSRDRNGVLWTWGIAAVAASAYGTLDFLGLGFPDLFRVGDYYLGTVTRLSGSFEYPTTAAAYFALSIPLVWALAGGKRWWIGAAVLVWLTLVLTFSRGAIAAVVGMYALAWIARRLRPTDGIPRKALIPDSSLWPVAIGAAVYLAVGFFEPFLVERFRTGSERAPVDAVYEPAFNVLTLAPDAEYRLPVRLVNTGRARWRPAGSRKVGLSYYWYDVWEEEIIDLEPLETSLPREVGTGESVEVIATIRTPGGGGLYLLDLELRQRDFGWFSSTGVYPGIVEVHVDADAPESWIQGDVSRWYARGPEFIPSLDASVSRMQLWRAALAMARDHPILGVGPDNYRLAYGRYLGYSRWDDNIRSNNMFLELVATVGVVGFLAFLFIMWSASFSWTPARMALGVFLLHSLVDVFLMTTSIYFGVWILLGFADESRV